MGFSKSRFTQGMNCPKALWLQRNNPEVFDESLVNTAILSQGTDVGLLAQSYYGEPDLICDPADLGKAISLTEKAIEAYFDCWRGCASDDMRGAEPLIICEATFSYVGCLCMVDVLRVWPDRSVSITEVKSATSVKEYYYDDLSYQYDVVMACGFTVAEAEILHVDNQYVLEGEFDLQGFLKSEDLTRYCQDNAGRTWANVERLDEYSKLPDEPVYAPGHQCSNPHKCGFFRWCVLRFMPKNSVFELQGVSWDSALKDVSKGICTVQEALAKKKLTGFKKTQARCMAEGESYVDKEALRAFLGKLKFPIYHLDFEAINEAVPRLEGTRPYQQVPTQYSLHIQHADGRLEHREFLADPNGDWRRDLAERLVADIPEGVCTIAYNAAYEKLRIQELAERFPDLADKLLCIVRSMTASASKTAPAWKHAQARRMRELACEWGSDGLFDLMEPFKSGAVWSPKMGSSYSIKYVLPALFPDEPSLDYGNLVSCDPSHPELVIRKGDKAAEMFAHLLEYTPHEQEVIAENLLRYCEKDTLATVMTVCKLMELSEKEVRQCA